MVARSPNSSLMLPSSDNNGVQQPSGSRRQLLGKLGSWVKYSWRKSTDSLMDSICEDGDIFGNGLNGTEEELTKIPKHVHFTYNEDGDNHDDPTSVVTEIINDGEEDAFSFSEEDAKQIWYQNFDFQRFEKDRRLTSMDYTNARRSNKTFVEDSHSVRGLEHLCDESLHKRQAGERKDLYKAVKAEEAKQKEEGTFPNFDRFRVVCLRHTKAGKQRAIAKANEDAREQLQEMR
ncbi:hypothetical protein IV203_007085 [Nitzschia inconspicua]|uniref:Uncharacterized protein n=1 Tax=Nitzschia inconspicua TaxID=303405 RepID=A0A9K3KE86_9STRA|nr:hypothetical protein IV203_007085 [Nitzschia inconspicua]